MSDKQPRFAALSRASEQLISPEVVGGRGYDLDPASPEAQQALLNIVQAKFEACSEAIVPVPEATTEEIMLAVSDARVAGPHLITLRRPEQLPETAKSFQVVLTTVVGHNDCRYMDYLIESADNQVAVSGRDTCDFASLIDMETGTQGLRSIGPDVKATGSMVEELFELIDAAESVPVERWVDTPIAPRWAQVTTDAA